MPAKQIVLTREQLYRKVWEIPMISLAPTLGLSDNGLRKVCRRYDIPMPRVGHWAKKQHGHPTRQTQLPKVPDDFPTVYTFHVHETVRKVVDNEGRQVLGSAAERYLHEFNRQHPAIEVFQRLSKPHALVKEAKGLFDERKRPSADGRIDLTTKKCLDVCFSPEVAPRAWRVLDTLLKLIEDEGFEVMVVKEDRVIERDYHGRPSQTKAGYSTCAKIYDELVRFRLHEIVESQRVERTSRYGYTQTEWDYYATGKLCFELLEYLPGEKRRWNDALKQRVENCIPKIYGKLVMTADKLLRRRFNEKHREKEQKRSMRRQNYKAAKEKRSKKHRECENLRINLKFLDLEKRLDSWGIAYQLESLARGTQQANGLSDADVDKGVSRAARWCRWVLDLSQRHRARATNQPWIPGVKEQDLCADNIRCPHVEEARRASRGYSFFG